MNIEIPKNKIQLFFLGFYILAIGSSLMSVPNIPIVINRFIQLLGILFISILFSVKAYYGNMGLYARSIFLLFVTYQLVIIFRDNQLSLWGIQRHIFTPGYLLYVAPILIYKLSDLLFINQIIRLVTLLCKTFVFGIILFLPYLGNIDARVSDESAETMDIYCGIYYNFISFNSGQKKYFTNVCYSNAISCFI